MKKKGRKMSDINNSSLVEQFHQNNKFEISYDEIAKSCISDDKIKEFVEKAKITVRDILKKN